MLDKLTVVIATILGATQIADAPPDFTTLSKEMAERCADGRYSGVVTVAVRGRTVFQESCGEGVTQASRFKIFSTSKLLTALAVTSLVEDGRMRLDAPAATYIPDLPPGWRRVTIQQLLNHTSGLPDVTNELLTAFSTDHAAAMRTVLSARRDDPQMPDGASWRYNNFGYELLADAAAHAAGAPFNQVLHDQVLAPANMNHTTVELAMPGLPGEDPTMVPDTELIAGYVKGEEGRIREATSYSFVQLGAGAVHTTAGDMLALEDAIRLNRIISADAWLRMVEMSIPNAPSVPSARYGLGVMIRERGGLRVEGHTGGNNGYVSAFRRVPERGAVIVALSNWGWSENDWIEEAAAAALAKAP